MFYVDNVLVEGAIATTNFSCPLELCQGMCCVSGDDGCTVIESELKLIQDNLRLFQEHQYYPILNDRWFYTLDSEIHIAMYGARGPCVFSFVERGIHKCLMEMLYYKGLFPMPKPLSCHLFPIRATMSQGGGLILSMETIKECKTAVNTTIPLHRFLKKPLIRLISSQWYKKLDKIVLEIRRCL